jgi:hypothetical protein
MTPDGKAKPKREGAGKNKKTHGQRALAGIRAAKRDQREVSDPVERVRILLAEANVLALLDLADAFAPRPAVTHGKADGAPSPPG